MNVVSIYRDVFRTSWLSIILAVENQEAKDYGTILITDEKQRKADIQRGSKGAEVQTETCGFFSCAFFLIFYIFCSPPSPPPTHTHTMRMRIVFSPFYLLLYHISSLFLPGSSGCSGQSSYSALVEGQLFVPTSPGRTLRALHWQ